MRTLLEKLFVIFLTIASVSFGAIVWLSRSALMDAVGLDLAMADFYFYADILTYGVPFTFAVMLAFANRHAMVSNRFYMFWAALAFYWLFTVVDYVYLSAVFFDFTRRTGQWKGGSSVTWLVGLFWCIVGGAAVLINYMAINTYKKYK